MNFDLLGKAIGWLPGAAVGALVGGLVLWVVWDDAAHIDQCDGTFVYQPCLRLFGTSLELVPAVAAFTALGALAGVLVSAIVTAVRRPRDV